MNQARNLVPTRHDTAKRHAPIMFTTDLALKFRSELPGDRDALLAEAGRIQLAFSKAWFKLTHRDMGPRSRYQGSEVPAES